MQRRYRVFTGRRRRRGLLTVPPQPPPPPVVPVPAITRQHRKARLPPHHRRGRHLLHVPPVVRPLLPVMWSAGRGRNGVSTGMVLTQPATSAQYVQVQVTATLRGAAYDPTGDTVQVAFVPMPGWGPAPGPQPGQWQAAGWDAGPGGTWWAGCLIAPAASGGIPLPPGAYQMFVTIADYPTVPVLPGPALIIT